MQVDATAALVSAGGGVALAAPDRLASYRRGPAAEAPVGQARAGRVALVPLRGVLVPRAGGLLAELFGLGGVEGFEQRLRAAAVDPRVSSIVVPVDSPGGLVAAIPETAAAMRAVRAAKPIVAVASYLAASAAYWLASQADELVVTPSGSVGSVGAMVEHVDLSRALDREGVKVTYVHAGKHKVEGNPYEPLGKEARAYLQGIVDRALDRFAADVAAGRGVGVADVKGPRFGEGRMFDAEEAVERGMADRVATLETVINELAGGRRPARREARSRAYVPASPALRARGRITSGADRRP